MTDISKLAIPLFKPNGNSKRHQSEALIERLEVKHGL